MRKVFLILLFITQTIFSQNILSDTISHEVERRETLFSISQKYNINVNDILELNPELRNSRLRRKSTILIPVFDTIQVIEILEKDSLQISSSILSLDSIYAKKRNKSDQLNVSVLLPFRSSTVNFDSIKEVESLFEDRNLYTISLDFYSGILYALDDLKKLDVTVNLNLFDTNNSLNQILEIANNKDLINTIEFILERNF